MRTKAEARKRPRDRDLWRDSKCREYQVLLIGGMVTLARHMTDYRQMTLKNFFRWTARAEYLGGAE
jgi:hypothetical protein